MVLIVVALCLFAIGTGLAFKIRRDKLLRQQAAQKRILKSKKSMQRRLKQALPMLFT